MRNQKRNTLKVISAAGVATALAPKSWTKPVISSVLLPAHAQTSAPPPPPVQTIFEYFIVVHSGTAMASPREMSVTVDATTGMASVVALNRFNNIRPEIMLNIDGTPSNAFTGTIDPSCGGFSLPGASWNVVGYTVGDPTISITTSGGGGWTVVAPLATGTVSATCL